MAQGSRQNVRANIAACIVGLLLVCQRPSLAMVDPNDCIPGVLPRDGHVQTSLVKIVEREFGMPFICILCLNWLRDRDDPDALKIPITWIHAASNCRVRRSMELAGDLTEDGRVDLHDLSEYARWWLHEWVPYP